MGQQWSPAALVMGLALFNFGTDLEQRMNSESSKLAHKTVTSEVSPKVCSW